MKICIIEPDETQHVLLQRALKENGFEHCHVLSGTEDIQDEQGADRALHLLSAGIQAERPYDLAKPYRFGALLDKIRQLKNSDTAPHVMDFKSCRIDVRESFFFDARHQKGVRLTEKELEILVYLAKQCGAQGGGQPVRREDLLQAVWGYGDNIETHTLETHIYRLRQKIEADPSEPDYLQTRDEGYIFIGDPAE